MLLVTVQVPGKIKKLKTPNNRIYWICYTSTTSVNLKRRLN